MLLSTFFSMPAPDFDYQTTKNHSKNSENDLPVVSTLWHPSQWMRQEGQNDTTFVHSFYIEHWPLAPSGALHKPSQVNDTLREAI